MLNATDKNFFRKYSREEVESAIVEYNLGYKEYLLFVGTIDYPGKNIKTVIEAFFNLRTQGKKLVIIGKDGFNSKVIMTLLMLLHLRMKLFLLVI